MKTINKLKGGKKQHIQMKKHLIVDEQKIHLQTKNTSTDRRKK